MDDKTLCFDIETIPQIAPLSDIQSEELNRKLENYMAYHTNEDPEEAKRKLMGTNPFFGEIVCIGLGYEANGSFKTKALIGEEKQILTEFWEILSKFNGTFVSYNGIEFDAWFVITRTMMYNITITNKNFIDTRRFQKRPHFDVKQILSDWDKYRSITLNLACDYLGVSSPKDGLKAKDVWQAYAEGRIDEIAEYCLKDITATYQIYNIVKNYTLMR
jgi:hypothetical protein